MLYNVMSERTPHICDALLGGAGLQLVQLVKYYMRRAVFYG